MSDLIVVLSLAEATVVSVAFFFAQRAWTRERADLLNRLMARDFREYQAYAAPKEEPKPMTEAERKAAEQEARDIEAAHGIA